MWKWVPTWVAFSLSVVVQDMGAEQDVVLDVLVVLVMLAALTECVATTAAVSLDERLVQ